MRRKRLYFLGLIALVAVVVALVRRDFDMALFLRGFSSIRPAWLAASMAGTFTTYVIRAARWQVLLRSLKRISIGSLTSATMLGFCAIYALGRAGEVFRPVWIARREEISTTGSIATIVLERVFDVLLLVGLFAVTLEFVRLPIEAVGALSLMETAAWILFAGSSAALGVSVLFQQYVGVLTGKLRHGKLQRFLETFREGLAAMSTPRDVGLVAGYSLILWLVIALQFWLMLIGLNLAYPLAASTLVLVGSALGSIAQVPGIGGGFQAAFVFCLTTFLRVPVETAVAAALMAWIVTYAPTLIAGAIYMMLKGISTRELIVSEPVRNSQ